MTCIKCKKEAEYVSPNHFCLRHWVEWWCAGMGWKNKEDYKKDVRNTIRRIRYAERRSIRFNG